MKDKELVNEASIIPFTLKFSEQKEKERNCGQHCVSMITKLPVELISAEIGKKTGTDLKDISFILRRFGYDCDVTYTKFLTIASLPELAILNMRAPQGKRRGGHWAIHWKGDVWDSCLGVQKLTYEYLKEYKLNITKYFQVYV